MKMRKFLSFILSCTMCFATALAVGCDDNSSKALPVIEKLEIDAENFTLTLGDEMELPISYNVLNGKTMKWKSSAPSVVSVDEKGYVKALKVGSATITVEYGSKKDSCKIEVGLSGNVPVIAFDSGIQEDITIVKGTQFTLGAYVQFNGKAFYDGQMEYYVADKTIGDVVDGKFIAGDVAGSTEVSVVATWRGEKAHTKTISINVIPESTVLLNGGMLNSVHIYTAEQHEGVQYATEQTISSVFVAEDGEEVKNYTLSILDEGIAGLENSGNTWQIKAKKAGETKLLVSYEGKNFYFDVVVSRPVKVLDGVVNYSIADEKFFDEASGTMKPVSTIIEGLDSVVSYEVGGKEYKLKEDKLHLSESKENTITFYSEKVGYQVSCDVYTMIIDELQDFVGIYAGETTKLVTGTYMLGRDIIEPDTVLSFPEGMKPNNFGGDFDGKGHVLSFTFNHTQEYRCGLFGQFLNGATIKNLALHNVTKNGTSSKAPAGILCGEGGENNGDFSTIENIYAHVIFSEAGKSNIAFMGNAMWKVNLKNVIVYAPNVPMVDIHGSFARGEVASTSNSYVISPAPIYAPLTTQAEKNWKNFPPLYADYAAFKGAGLDFNSFSVEFWDVTTYGVPVWKTLVSEFNVL